MWPLQAAQREHDSASSTSSWLWAAVGGSGGTAGGGTTGGGSGRVADSGLVAGGRAPVTPMSVSVVTPVRPPAAPVAPATTGRGGPAGGAQQSEEVALRAKVDKLRWLLACANKEIGRLQQEAGGGAK